MDTEPSLGVLLRRLTAALDGDVQQLYDAMGLPFRPRFFPIVRHLRDAGSATVGTLVERCGVSQPAITQTLAEMRAAELIEASASGQDRRERVVRLTAAGEQVSERLEPVWAAVARAGAALDAELPAPLGATVAAALARLDDRRFLDRVREEMTE